MIEILAFVVIISLVFVVDEKNHLWFSNLTDSRKSDMIEPSKEKRGKQPWKFLELQSMM